jgi:hypothetical protein
MDINSVNVKFELSHNQKVNKVTVFCSQKELETVFHSGLKGTVIVKDKIIHLTQINERSASLEKITNCVYRIKNSSFNEKDRVTIFSKDGEFTDSEFAFYVDTGIVVLNDCSKTPTRVIISSENQILKV